MFLVRSLPMPGLFTELRLSRHRIVHTTACGPIAACQLILGGPLLACENKSIVAHHTTIHQFNKHQQTIYFRQR